MWFLFVWLTRCCAPLSPLTPRASSHTALVSQRDREESGRKDRGLRVCPGEARASAGRATTEKPLSLTHHLFPTPATTAAADMAAAVDAASTAMAQPAPKASVGGAPLARAAASPAGAPRHRPRRHQHPAARVWGCLPAGPARPARPERAHQPGRHHGSAAVAPGPCGRRAPAPRRGRPPLPRRPLCVRRRRSPRHLGGRHRGTDAAPPATTRRPTRAATCARWMRKPRLTPSSTPSLPPWMMLLVTPTV